METPERVIAAFGDRVRQVREQRGVSQEAFAQQADIDRSYYGRIERGEANPTLRQIAMIANALGLSVAQLFRKGRSSPKGRLNQKG